MALPGVLAVLTGADFLADGLKPIPHKPWSPHPAEIVLHNSDGSEAFTAPHYPLPADKARFVGEAVAMVVADNAAGGQGRRRAGRGRLRAVLPAVTDTMAAAQQDAPRVHEEARSNVCIDAELGDAAATAAAFARAAHVVDASRPGCSASPACRWSRAPCSPRTIPKAGATRSMPATAARCG